MSIDVMKQAFSVTEAAQALGVSRTTIYALINEGRLTRIKCFRRSLIPASSLAGFLKQPQTGEGK